MAVTQDLTPEELGDRVREVLGDSALQLESLDVVSETAYDALPASAIHRMGIQPHQKNLLIRLVIRDPVRTLTAEEANRLRDRVYAAVHEGEKGEWAR